MGKTAVGLEHKTALLNSQVNRMNGNLSAFSNPSVFNQ